MSCNKLNNCPSFQCGSDGTNVFPDVDALGIQNFLINWQCAPKSCQTCSVVNPNVGGAGGAGGLQMCDWNGSYILTKQPRTIGTGNPFSSAVWYHGIFQKPLPSSQGNFNTLTMDLYLTTCNPPNVSFIFTNIGKTFGPFGIFVRQNACAILPRWVVLVIGNGQFINGQFLNFTQIGYSLSPYSIYDPTKPIILNKSCFDELCSPSTLQVSPL